MSTTSPSSPESIAPLFNIFAEAARSPLEMLILHTIFGAILIPMLIALIYFSTAKQRQGIMFWSVAFDITLGIATAGWQASVMFQIIFNLLSGVSAATYTAVAVIQGLTAWIVELTLLLRLYAVFPLFSTNKFRFITIFSFPVAIKAVRLGLIVAAGVLVFGRVSSGSKHGAVNGPSTPNLDISIIGVEGCCALADHLYVSTLFLHKLYGGFAYSQDSGRISNGNRGTFVSRIRTLFYISLGNLVFPVIFNVLVIAIYFSRASVGVAFILASNVYVTILGVVFATVWNSSSSLQGQQSTSSGSSSSPPSSLWFQRDIATSTDKNSKNGGSHYMNTIELGSRFTMHMNDSTGALPVQGIMLGK